MIKNFNEQELFKYIMTYLNENAQGFINKDVVRFYYLLNRVKTLDRVEYYDIHLFRKLKDSDKDEIDFHYIKQAMESFRDINKLDFSIHDYRSREYFESDKSINRFS